MNEQKKAERMTAQGVGPQSSMLLCSESKNIFPSRCCSWPGRCEAQKPQPIFYFFLLRQFNRGILKEEAQNKKDRTGEGASRARKRSREVRNA